MKKIILIALLIFSATLGSLAQTKFEIQDSKNPLFIIKIKGQPDFYYNTQSPRLALSTINQTSIQSMEVLKDSTATALYGNQGRNGVITITLTDSATLITKDVLFKNYKINGKSKKLPVFLDGMKLQNADTMYFDPSGIKSVNVEKDQKYINILTFNGIQTAPTGPRIRGKAK